MTPKTEFNAQSSDAEHHLNQASHFYEETEEFEKALQACDTALELDPYLAEAHNLRGIILEEFGKVYESRKAYQQAITLDPDFTEAKDNLAALEVDLAHEDELVTIATFSHPLEAYVRKTKLDANGLPSFVADDNTVALIWLLSNAIGGVKLQVRSSDVKQAQEILSDETQSVEDNFEEAGEAKCPNCQSMNIYPRRYNMSLIFGVWFLSWLLNPFFVGLDYGGFPLPFLRRRWQCSECGHNWRNRDLAEVNS